MLDQTDPGGPGISEKRAVGSVCDASRLGYTLGGRARDYLHSVGKRLCIVLTALAVVMPALRPPT